MVLNSHRTQSIVQFGGIYFRNIGRACRYALEI
jgi:hypothetical protein